MGDAYMN